jgi:hypothetical protein
MREIVCHNLGPDHRKPRPCTTSQAKVICKCGEQLPLFAPDEIAIVLKVTNDGFQFQEVVWYCLDGIHRAMFKQMGGGERVRELVDALTRQRTA